MALRKKYQRLTDEQIREALARCKAWKCFSCHAVLNKEYLYCPECKNGTVEPMIDIPYIEQTCPACGYEKGALIKAIKP